MNFVVLDVETANAELSSICQIGIVAFRNGAINNKWQSLINPQDEFHPINISIHGIDEASVKDAPTWAASFPVISSLLRDNIVVSHTPFDRVAVTRACERYELEWCACRWLDSARVVRRAWPIFSQSGYGLSNVAAHFGIHYQEHDALDDARCAGEILIRAITETRILCPRWDESPAHQRQLADWLFRMLADDRHGLGGRNVVTRIPVFIAGGGVEVLLDKLLSPRKFVATAHENDYGMSTACSRLDCGWVLSLRKNLHCGDHPR